MTDFTKHTVHTDALDTLGSIIGPEEKRDAIHLAVYPVEAGEILAPGVHVKLDAEDGRAYRCRFDRQDAVGIVDPFLPIAVQPDCRFWLVVYPRQITSLRHVWEHEAFPPSGEAPDLIIEIDKERRKGEAETWLREFVAQGDLPDFETVIGAAAYSGRNGLDYVSLSQDGSGSIPSEFWHHLEVYLDERFQVGPKAEYFSCAC